MGHPSPAPTEDERRRLRRSVGAHGLAAVVFGLLAWSGAAGLREAHALGVPLFIAGCAGSLGALSIAVSIHRSRAQLAGPPASRGPGRTAQRAARLSMALAAVAVVAVGLVLAPTGVDRGFVITVDTVMAGALALFALFAGDGPRPVSRLG